MAAPATRGRDVHCVVRSLGLRPRAIDHFCLIDVVADAIRIRRFVILLHAPSIVVRRGVLPRHQSVGICEAQEVSKASGSIARTEARVHHSPRLDGRVGGPA